MSVVITGNPGVGKHTIGKNLAKSLGYKILDINKIALEYGTYDKKSRTLDVDVKKLKTIIKKKITNKSLIVGHLAPYVLTKKQVKLVIVIRKNPYKLIPIYKKRKYSRKKIAENLGSEILGVIAYDSIKQFGKFKLYQIDATSKTVSKTTKLITQMLEDKIEGDKVDWLSLITKKNDLKKFFSY